MPDLSVNEVYGFDVYVSGFNFPKKVVGFKRTEEEAYNKGFEEALKLISKIN
jgi:hypothetical protein